jgi:hypothetical protein
MSNNNIIFVVMYHRHKVLDLIYDCNLKIKLEARKLEPICINVTAFDCDSI